MGEVLTEWVAGDVPPRGAFNRISRAAAGSMPLVGLWVSLGASWGFHVGLFFALLASPGLSQPHFWTRLAFLSAFSSMFLIF